MGYPDQETARVRMAQLDHDHAHASAHGDHQHTAALATSCCCGGKHDAADKAAVTAAIDPVCGMRVDPATAKHRFSYHSEDYFFCSGRCRERFEAEPEKFLQP